MQSTSHSFLYRLKNIGQLFLQAVKGEDQDYTALSINKGIFMLAVPMILEKVLESLFAVVDVFFVSKVSVNAVATIGLTESVLTIVYSVAIGLSIGAGALVARRVGEKNFDSAGYVAAQAILIAGAISFIISLVGIFFSENILRLLGGSDALIAEGLWFTRIMFTGNAVIIFIFLLNGIYRGAGNAAVAMRTLWLSNGINLILDPILIFGLGPFPEMGLTGAAIATTIGRGVGVCYQVYYLLGGKTLIKTSWAHFKADWAIIKTMVNVSLGGVGQFLIESASWIFLVRIVSLFGSEALAGYTIALRIIVFTILPTFGLSNAAATLVGQNLGANQPEKAAQSAWRTAFYAMLFLGFVSVVFVVFAKPILSLFNTNPEVLSHGIQALQIICLGYIFFAYGMIISQSLNGAGDTKTPIYINLFCFWLIQIPLAYLLAVTFKMGPSGVFTAIAICFSIHAIICAYVFKLGRWKLVKV
jgi:putative MATE family efflux protein